MSGFSLLPSAYDRLDPLAAFVRWWTSQLRLLSPQAKWRVISVDALETMRRAPGSVLIELSEKDAFHARVALPKGSPEQHRKALQLRLVDLSPVNPQELAMVAIADEFSDQGMAYSIAMARSGRLAQLEKLAQKKGARAVAFRAGSNAGAQLLSDGTRQRRNLRLMVDAGFFCLVALGASLAIQVWTHRIGEETAAINAAERSLRRAMMTSETAAKEARLAADLASQGVLKRRASAAFEALAQISAATPNTAWWTSYRWAPDSITLAGQSPDATGAIRYLAEKSPTWRLEIGGQINAAGAGGIQSFEIRLQPKYPPHP